MAALKCRLAGPGWFRCHCALESECLGDKGRREIPEQSAQGLDLDQVGENFLASKSYKQGGSELFRGVTGSGVCVCCCVFPSAFRFGR